MADVDVFLNEEWPALGDSEALEKQLEQCTVGAALILWNESAGPNSDAFTDLH